jgi:hypothetical protein
VAASIIVHLENLARREKKLSPFSELADRNTDVLIEFYMTKYQHVCVLLPHLYRDTITQVPIDFLANKQALNRVFAFRCCQSMKHLDLWDESTLPRDSIFEIQEESAPASDETESIINQSSSLSKPRAKE